MDDKTLVQRLDTAIKDDHERGCQGRYYSCTCGYDNDCSQTLQDAKSHIEALEAALRKIEGQAVCVAIPATEDEMRDWLQNILETTQQALEGSGNG